MHRYEYTLFYSYCGHYLVVQVDDVAVYQPKPQLNPNSSPISLPYIPITPTNPIPRPLTPTRPTTWPCGPVGAVKALQLTRPLHPLTPESFEPAALRVG
jgi:hypothetical protein